MDDEAIILKLEKEWDFDHGFFGLLRRGAFDSNTLQRLLDTLKRIEIQEGPLINRRLVSLLWYIPIFMEWQRESMRENGIDIDEFDKATNLIQSLVERLLGVP